MAQVDSENSIAMPARSAGAIVNPGLARQQREREKALQRLRKLRTKAADEIDRLLAFLDASDLDPDLEPSLGWTEAGARSYGNDQGADDLEAEPEHLEDGADDEPSLGSHELPSGAVSYLQSYAHGHLDVEEQCDDEGVIV
ncbi:hypothetical protein [Bradyrhizobium sp. AUGA SZCCT0182]|uniref:hypothetical protein n=1 Tax=Bradyrhizobium sp. AUGA SZCCT0182 TaxID=2807667 RepID=UPI001BADAB57|nr:hypothetical protein [Bradyrhizobium sp. AUGA SZCCT0182]MBR1231970.1 hypothetical protein [Bradyrhizobium sp. AUGA SZCCT0182]